MSPPSRPEAPAPKLSVVVLAYNHEPFLRQALDGVLGQDVDFAYEVIVGEDCSTDGTRAVLQEYARRYPAVLRPIYQPRNVGMGPNFQACLAACRGEYIALLEGDDYWTSPLKLRRQVAWLDAHPDFSLCFHPLADHHEDGSRPDHVARRYAKDVYTFDDFVATTEAIAGTGSLVLRHVLPTWPAWLFTVIPIDYPLVLLYAAVGKAKLLPEVMGAYRIHGGGIWSGAPAHVNIKRFVLMYEQLWRHYAQAPFAGQLRGQLYDAYLAMANEYANLGRTAEALRFVKKAVRFGAGHRHRGANSLLKTGLRVARGLTR